MSEKEINLREDLEKELRLQAEAGVHAQAELHEEIYRLRGRIEALEACVREHEEFKLAALTAESLDAARYRYLRDGAGEHPDDDDGPMICAGLGDQFDFLRGPECDEAVDNAIKAFKGT